MAIKWQKKAVLAKIETTYGVDAAPAAANAIETVEGEITPMEGDLITHNVDRPYYGNYAQELVNKHVRVRFKVACAGSGTSGASITAPNWSALVRACGHVVTLDTTAGTATHGPISGNEASATLYFNVDGMMHKLLGARGAITGIEFSAGGYPYMSFEFFGLFVDVTQGAIPAVDYTGWQKPVAVNNANTTFSLHGYAAKLVSLNFNQNGQTTVRDLPGENSVQITGRAPSAEVEIEAPNLADKDFWTIAKNGTTGDLTITHGTTAGNIFKLTAPAVQLIRPAYGETDGIATLRMQASFLPTAGDDDYQIITS